MNKITKLRHWIDDTAKINRIKLGKPFQARLCLKNNNKSMGSFNFYEKSQHCGRLVFAVVRFPVDMQTELSVVSKQFSLC